MTDNSIPLVIISGPVGVGKTSVGNEISVQLEGRGVAHTFVDLDTLAMTFPRPADDPFASRLACTNLRDIWTNCAAAGSRNLIVARVIESPRHVAEIQAAVPGSVATVCQLRASDETLVARVGRREIGSEYEWHANRAVELAQSLPATAPPDFFVDTEGRAVPDIANDIVSRVGWQTAR